MIASKNSGKASVVVKPHVATAHQKAQEILREHRAPVWHGGHAGTVTTSKPISGTGTNFLGQMGMRYTVNAAKGAYDVVKDTATGGKAGLQKNSLVDQPAWLAAVPGLGQQITLANYGLGNLLNNNALNDALAPADFIGLDAAAMHGGQLAKAAVDVAKSPEFRGAVVGGAKAVGPSLGKGLTSGGFGELFSGVSEAAGAGARRAARKTSQETVKHVIRPDGAKVPLEVRVTSSGKAEVSPRVAQELGLDVGNFTQDDFLNYGKTFTVGNVKAAKKAAQTIGAEHHEYLTIDDFNATAKGGADAAQKIYDTSYSALGSLVGRHGASVNEVLDHFGVSGLSAEARKITQEEVNRANALYEETHGMPAVKEKGTTPHRDHPISKSGHAYEDVADLATTVKSLVRAGYSDGEIKQELIHWVAKKQEEINMVLDPSHFVLLQPDVNTGIKGSEALLSFIKRGNAAFEGQAYKPLRAAGGASTGMPMFTGFDPTLIRYRDIYALFREHPRFYNNDSLFRHVYDSPAGLGAMLEKTRTGSEKNRAAAQEAFDKALNNFIDYLD
jgi:hypothetical protein